MGVKDYIDPTAEGIIERAAEIREKISFDEESPLDCIAMIQIISDTIRKRAPDPADAAEGSKLFQLLLDTAVRTGGVS